MSDKQIAHDLAVTIDNAVFEIGGEDQLVKVKDGVRKLGDHADQDAARRVEEKWSKFLKETQIKIGTLLKTDSVSFLLGAGSSKDAGGIMLGKIPKEIEGALLSEGTSDTNVKNWLFIFYLAIGKLALNPDAVLKGEKEILKRKEHFSEECELEANYESVLSLLYRWRAALSDAKESLLISGDAPVQASARELEDAIKYAKLSLVRRCHLPTADVRLNPLETHKVFLKKILTRPLSLKRVNIFTLNYDTLIEQAADSEGVVVIDGFIGNLSRVFRPESYDQDLYFPAETTEGRVHRLDRVTHLYKLHGSINWVSDPASWDDPYGVSVKGGDAEYADKVLIYPIPTKYGDILGMPYSELFRRFAAQLVRPQSTLFVIGYGFGDEHVNTIIRQALSIPSFTIVIVDPLVPKPSSTSNHFLACLRARKDRRVWIFSGQTLGAFSSFTSKVLPDLRDEKILQDVVKTYRALQPEAISETEGGQGDAE